MTIDIFEEKLAEFCELRKQLSQQFLELHADHVDLQPIGGILETLESIASFLQTKEHSLFTESLIFLHDTLSKIVAGQIGYSEGIARANEIYLRFDENLEVFFNSKQVLIELRSNPLNLEKKADAETTHLEVPIPNSIIPEELAPPFSASPCEETSTFDVSKYANVIQEVPVEFLEEALLGEFIIEAEEGLEGIESDLLKLEKNPTDVSLIEPILRVAHTIKGTSGFLGLTVVGELGHRTEDLLVQVRDGERALNASIIDACFSSIDGVKKLMLQLKDIIEKGTAAPIDLQDPFQQLESCLAAPAQKTTIPYKPLGKILLDEGVVTEAQVQEALDTQSKAIGELLVEQGAVSPKAIEKALKRQKNMGKPKTVQEMVKVPASKLDDLSELVGEVVVALSLLSQNPDLDCAGRKALAHLDQLDKATERLRDQVLGIRMFPVGSVFSKLSRQVRDLSKKLQKPIQLDIEGGDTLVDKMIIDGIYGPMVHLVRNAIDHGIEDPNIRTSKSKPAEGKVLLKAHHAGDSVIIEIKDDGKGIQRDAILQKAISKGLVEEGLTLSDQEVFSFILQAGFSTAAKTTDVSGRGVGMDVVKRDIENLRGKLLIDSKVNEGSTFSIKLPLSTSIIEGLITQVGETRFIVPILDVVQTITPTSEMLQGTQGKDNLFFILAGEAIPIIQLHELYNIPSEVIDPSKSIILVVENHGKKRGIMVDELLHRQQVVIKSLGNRFRNLSGISGGSILGDGRIGFILDIEDLGTQWKHLE